MTDTKGMSVAKNIKLPDHRQRK